MKHFLSITDLSRDEIEFLFDLTSRVRSHPEVYADRLKGKTLGLIFEKPSTRTWASFFSGMTELGGNSLYLGPQDIEMGKREEIRDIARVLSGYLAGFVLRTFSHRTIVEFARYAGKPVVNGLSDFSHPCQVLADLYTLREKFGPDELPAVKFAYVGDANNVLNSLVFLFAKMGLNLYYATPRRYGLAPSVLRVAKKLAARSKAKMVGFHDPRRAVLGADVIYTDVWVSMGEEGKAADKKRFFEGFQVNDRLLSKAARDAWVMHCLPAHRGEEITNRVMEGRHSLIFEQAENRLQVQKAILLYLLTTAGDGLKHG